MVTESRPPNDRRLRFARKSRRAELDGLIETLELAGIHGRGGGAFPTGTKIRAVASASGTPSVIVNGSEGEPLSSKDRYLLRSRLDTVLDGALAVATALMASELVIAIHDKLRAEADAVREAVHSRPEFGRRVMSTRVELVPSSYITGQETALIAALSGREPKPTLTPPYPFTHGLHGQPSLICNVETFSQIGRAVQGSYDGTRLVTVSGAVQSPGLVEITPQTTLRSVIETSGGITEPASAVLLGGYGGTWAYADEVMDLPLDEYRLREHGLTLGAGIVFVLGDSRCPVAEVAQVANWMASQSAGQCGPCVHGLGSIAVALGELTRPGGGGSDYRRVERWAEMVKGRGACAHPDGVSRFVSTALEVFVEDFDDHAAHGGCDACVAGSILPTPITHRTTANPVGAFERMRESVARATASLNQDGGR